MIPHPGHLLPPCAMLPTTLLVFGLLGAVPAAAAPTSSLRIAVGLERSQELALIESPSDHTAMRALAQGVREACIDPANQQLRTLASTCKTLGDAGESTVCVDETPEQALTRQIECVPGDLTANAVDLARSGCETAGCYQVEARKAGASHLLLVAASWTDSGLTVTGQFIDLSDGALRAFGPADFAPRYSSVWPRTQPQVLGLLKWLARAQTGVALREAYTADRAGGRGEGAMIGVVQPAPKAPLLTVPGPEPSRMDRSWIGWTLIGAGVAAGVGTVIAWKKNGDLTDCDAAGACRKELHTMIPTVGLGVVAVSALVGATIVLIHERSDRAGLTLFLHSTSVALGGTW